MREDTVQIRRGGLTDACEIASVLLQSFVVSMAKELTEIRDC